MLRTGTVRNAQPDLVCKSATVGAASVRFEAADAVRRAARVAPADLLRIVALRSSSSPRQASGYQRSRDPQPQPRECSRCRPAPGGSTFDLAGAPIRIFKRAVQRRNVVAAVAAARELPQLSLIDALELTLLVARKDARRHQRVAARWLLRYLEEDSEATIEETALAASSLIALSGAGSTSRKTLQRTPPRPRFSLSTLHDGDEAPFIG
jgi:hypothetical protein